MKFYTPIKFILKKTLGENLLFHIIRLLKVCFFIRIEKLTKRTLLERLILTKYFSFGYQYYFENLDFQKAYYLRILYALYVYKGLLGGSKIEAQNYLCLMTDLDLLNFTGLENVINETIPPAENLKKLFEFKDFDKKTYDKVLLCGPKTDLSEVNIETYDLLVFNKIPVEEILNSGKDIIICTGNQWFLDNLDNLESLDKKYINLKIYSTTKSTFSYYGKIFDLLPKGFERSSLMNLQRTLLLISSTYRSSSVEVIGYNLFLSEVSKDPWYSSQAISNHDNPKKNIISSVKTHDYILNFNFLKLLITYNNFINISDEIDLNMNYKMLQMKFSKFYA